MSELMRLARALRDGWRSSTEPEAASTEEPTAPATVTAPTGACGSCAHFRPAPGKQPDGWCVKHRTETWAQFAGGCAADWQPADTAARELTRRRAEVVARLEADPSLRYGFDAQGASPTAPANGTVSVLLGLRMAGGSVVTGELHIPAHRWPGIVLFNEHLRMAAERLPS